MSLTGLISSAMTLMAFAIIARSLSTWFPAARNNPIVQILYQITDPILIPLSRIIPRVGMFDFTPMAAVFGLLFLASVISGA